MHRLKDIIKIETNKDYLQSNSTDKIKIIEKTKKYDFLSKLYFYLEKPSNKNDNL